jgi:hypothetical protein
MTDSVQTYVNDHLAGAAHAISLLGHLQSKHPSDRIGSFASKLLAEVKSDYETLQGIAIRIGAGSSALKETVSRLSEKIGRFKLDDHGTISFETFEGLEFMVLGIHGKRALWQALAACSESDSRLQNINYDALIGRAEQQEAAVESLRIDIAKEVLLPSN